MMKPSSLGPRRRFWARHVAAWRKSGQTRSAYAKEYGFHPETFSRWVRLLGFGEKTVAREVSPSPEREISPVQFASVPIDLVARATHPTFPRAVGGISVLVAQRFQVLVPDAFSPTTLADVIRALEHLE